jgi:hypothetical protein
MMSKLQQALKNLKEAPHLDVADPVALTKQRQAEFDQAVIEAIAELEQRVANLDDPLRRDPRQTPSSLIPELPMTITPLTDAEKAKLLGNIPGGVTYGDDAKK